MDGLVGECMEHTCGSIMFLVSFFRLCFVLRFCVSLLVFVAVFCVRVFCFWLGLGARLLRACVGACSSAPYSSS